MKPMLASDYDQSKVKFPCVWQPKIDGVRALNMLGPLTTRQLKPHANRHVSAQFSHPDFVGFDGEMAAAQWTSPDLCMLTTSALSTIDGAPYVQWWIFDYVTDATAQLPYMERLQRASTEVERVRVANEAGKQLLTVPWMMVRNMDELLERDMEALSPAPGHVSRDRRRRPLPTQSPS